MTDITKALIKRPSIFIMITGAILLIIGVSRSIDVANFTILIGDPIIQWAIIAIGIFLISIGIYLEAKYSSLAKISKINSPQNETTQEMVTYRDAVKVGFIVSVILVIPPALFGLSSIPFFLFIAFPLCTIGASISLKYFTKTRTGLWIGAAVGAFLVCFLFTVFLIYALSRTF